MVDPLLAVALSFTFLKYLSTDFQTRCIFGIDTLNIHCFLSTLTFCVHFESAWRTGPRVTQERAGVSTGRLPVAFLVTGMGECKFIGFGIVLASTVTLLLGSVLAYSV